MIAVNDTSSPKSSSKAKPAIRPAPTAEYNKVKRNAKGILLNQKVTCLTAIAGGVLITPEEIRAAFEFLDVDGEKKVSMSGLKRRLQVFFPNMTTKEYRYIFSCMEHPQKYLIAILTSCRFLMNNKREITEADLLELLQDNDVTNFDPVYEAFRAYDTDGEGTISLQRLRDVFTAFGLGELSATEVEILTRVWRSFR